VTLGKRIAARPAAFLFDEPQRLTFGTISVVIRAERDGHHAELGDGLVSNEG
jgi:ABC-type sugar transport system ATPase subunit